MKALRTMAVAVALAGTAGATMPASAKTAFQYWAQGEGAYVSSKDHPSDLYEYFQGMAPGPALPATYYDPYGRRLPPYAPYGEAGY